MVAPNVSCSNKVRLMQLKSCQQVTPYSSMFILIAVQPQASLMFTRDGDTFS